MIEVVTHAHLEPICYHSGASDDPFSPNLPVSRLGLLLPILITRVKTALAPMQLHQTQAQVNHV